MLNCNVHSFCVNSRDSQEAGMKYRVHRYDIDMTKGQDDLERYLNSLEGEVVSIIPNNKNTTLAQIYGITRKIDFLLVIEKLPG